MANDRLAILVANSEINWYCVFHAHGNGGLVGKYVVLRSTKVLLGGLKEVITRQLPSRSLSRHQVLSMMASLSTDDTFADLDGNPNAAIPTDVSGDTITCKV